MDRAMENATFMEQGIVLPSVNESGCYEIRLESIGGLGANLCGKLLGELGLYVLGLNSASFSSYGSEKTGTPVKAYIRYCAKEKEIRVHSPVRNPHLLAIFHDALLRESTTLEGCTGSTTVLVNTGNQTGIAENISGVKSVYVVPGQQIAMETHARINVVMLGALAKVSGFIPLEAALEICERLLGKKYPDALSGNLEGIKRGYREVQRLEIGQKEPKQQEVQEHKTAGSKEKSNQSGQLTGGIIAHPGNSVVNDLSPSRQGYIPIFIQERCINCGLCDSTCPDMVFQFGKGIYRGKEQMVNHGLDYYHCKGCMRCVAVCPTQALVKGLEAEHPDKSWFLPNQDLLRMPDYYEAAGADGYITSESYLTEKRVDGGEV